MIYVMSDIHGQKRRFDSVMKQINLQPEDTLYVLGDVIDRNRMASKSFVRSWRCQMPKCFWVTTN